MKTNSPSITCQRGAATLLTALILLISITLVTFMTAKTVLVETQMSANNYRTSQATAAANAAMDYALAYFGDAGNTTFACVAASYPPAPVPPATVPAIFVQDHIYPASTASVCIDNTTTRPLTTPWGVTINTPCVTISGALTAGMIIATGYSDDGTAQRTATQCVGSRSLMAGGSPLQSLVSGGSVGLTGSAQLINRYNDTNVWSAGAFSVGSGAMETYIRPVNIEMNQLTTAQLNSTATTPIPNVQKVSSKDLGSGTDVYASDGVLAAAMAATVADKAISGHAGDGPNTFFDMVYPGVRKAELARSAQATGQPPNGQLLATGASSSHLSGKSGIVYVQGNASFGGNNTIGTAAAPVLLFVDGDFDLTGGDIFGAIYVTGKLTGAGSPKISGTIITEAGVNRGAGTVTLVYTPFGGGSGGGSIMPGLTGVIAGSWRDW